MDMKRISAVLASLLFLSGCGVSAENSESSPYTETAFTTIAEETTATSTTTSTAKYTAETTTASASTAVYTAKQPKKATIQETTAVSAPEPVSTAEAAVTSTAESTRAPRTTTTATETTVTSTAAVVTTTAVPRTEPAVTTSIVTETVTEVAAESRTILPNDGSDYGKASAIYEYMLRNGSGTCVNRACQTYELCVDNGLDCCIVWTRAGLYGHVANIVRVEGIWYVLDTDGEFFLTYNNGFTEAVDIDGNHIADSDIISSMSYDELH